MIAKLIGAAALVVALGSPAWADVGSCGSSPYAPVLPSASDIGSKSPAAAQAAKHQAFLDVKAWQDSLKPFRACLQALSDSDHRQIASLDPNTNAEKVTKLTDEAKEADGEYDDTVDQEKKVVGEYVALQNAFCSRKDVDRSTCPK